MLDEQKLIEEMAKDMADRDGRTWLGADTWETSTEARKEYWRGQAESCISMFRREISEQVPKKHYSRVGNSETDNEPEVADAIRYGLTPHKCSPQPSYGVHPLVNTNYSINYPEGHPNR